MGPVSTGSPTTEAGGRRRRAPSTLRPPHCGSRARGPLNAGGPAASRWGDPEGRRHGVTRAVLTALCGPQPFLGPCA
eukprot:4730266-Lingulodinium_polyedra.AAC.1